MSRSISLLLALASACDGSSPPPDAPGGDGSRSGDAPVARPDASFPVVVWSAGYTRVRAVFDAGPPGSPIDYPIDVDVFLPDGPVEAGRVLVRRTEWPSEHAEAVIGADGRAVTRDLFCMDCTLTLDVAEPCLSQGAGWTRPYVQRAAGADQLVRMTTMPVCPIDGAAPVAVGLGPDPSIDAIGAIGHVVVAGAPIDVASATAATITVGGTTRAMAYEGDAWGGRYVLDAPLDPRGEVTVDLPAFRTVLGTPATVDVVAPLTTTAVLADPTFETEPTPGSIVTFGYPLVVESGRLVLRDEGRWPRRSAFAAVVALGDPGTATTVRVEATESLREFSHTAVALLREGGARSATGGLSTSPARLAVPAGAGDLWLLIANPQSLGQPSDRADPEVFAIEAITLE